MFVDVEVVRAFMQQSGGAAVAIKMKSERVFQVVWKLKNMFHNKWWKISTLLIQKVRCQFLN